MLQTTKLVTDERNGRGIAAPPSKLRRYLDGFPAARHLLSAVGPLTVSAAHFLASFMLLRVLSATEFGEFSFVIVLSALAMTVTNGLLGAPLSTMAGKEPAIIQRELFTYFKCSLVLSVALAIACLVGVAVGGMSVGVGCIFAAYCGLMSFRLFARTYAYNNGLLAKVILSDCSYSLSVAVALTCIAIFAHISLLTCAITVFCSAVLALSPFGLDFWRYLAKSLRKGSLAHYGTIWRDLTRWSFLGVVTTELTINAHAYLVTFISGAKAFAIISAGALVMRPFSLVAAALPDRERPVMAQHIFAGRLNDALKIAKEYSYVIGLIWVASALLAAFVLLWYPSIFIRKGYDGHQFVIIVILWALICAVRGLRSPDAVMLQAARQFRALADASTKSSIVTLIATAILLVLVSPTASLAGILIGDLVMWGIILLELGRWKRQYRSPEGACDFQ